MALVKFGQGAFASYDAGTKDPYQIYFTTDTKQIFVGQNEYTKGTKVLNAAPVDDETEGNIGTLYFYNNTLYLCEASETTGKYKFTRVANINDVVGSVTSVAAEDGVETASGQAITSTGTIKHSVPSGASTLADDLTDQTAAFGSTFAIDGITTDKFGHVTGRTQHSVTMPSETALTITPAAGTATTLAYGTTFAAITGVAKGEGSHAITATETVFTVPESDDTTYTISSTSEGIVTLTPSSGNSSTALINGWNDLAKKSDLTAVLKFKGTKATYEDLEAVTGAEVGDVWAVTADNSEYVCVATGTPATWEKLGPVIDLSAYALSADVIQRVTGEEGEVPKFKADGTIESTGFTLGCSVPATAVFTDTTYSDVTAVEGAESGLMTSADKIKLDSIEADAEVNIIETVKVAGTALTPDADRAVDVTLTGLGISSSATAIDAAVAAVEWDIF